MSPEQVWEATAHSLDAVNEAYEAAQRGDSVEPALLEAHATLDLLKREMEKLLSGPES